MSVKILFVGDVFGRPGREMLERQLPPLKQSLNVDLCIVNGENAAGGRGITYEVAKQLYGAGADIITLGNHAWDNKSVFSFIDEDACMVRPMNYPSGVPGRGFTSLQTKQGHTIVVAQVLCRLFMQMVDCPFQALDAFLANHSENDIIIIDTHGEATSEKVSMGWHLDGRVSAVLGTHTHVPTADERILPKGTAYITDVGMSGPYDSVIGMDIDTALTGFLTTLRKPFKIASENVKLCAVYLEIDEQSGAALSIERVVRQDEANYEALRS